jgi:hypothetical protein
MLDIKVRSMRVMTEIKHEEARRPADMPLRRAAVSAVIENPFAGHYVEDLGPMIEASHRIGEAMADHLMGAAFFADIQSYGKGGIVGLGGEQEHAHALLTSVFTAPFCELIGGTSAWTPAVTKIGAPGTLIDIPMNAKVDIHVRSHHDGMGCSVPDAPLPDEVVLFFCVASRGRLNARVGGLTYEQAQESLTK